VHRRGGAWSISLSALLIHLVFPICAWATEKFEPTPPHPSSSPVYLDMGRWSELICNQLSSDGNKWRLDDLQNAGFHLANVSLVYLATTGREPEADVVRQRAREEAQKNNHLGYSTGKCSGQSKNRHQYWMMTTASPLLLDLSHLSQTSDGVLKSLSDVHCRQLQIQGIGFNDNVATQFHLSEFPLQGPSAQKEWEVFGVYCFPKSTDYGPVLWALLPTPKSGALQQSSQTASSTPDADPSLTRESLHSWINQKRSERHLRELALIDERKIIDLVQSQQHKEGVKHLRPRLQSQRTALLRAGYHFLGENRVQADSLGEATHLLWQSPAHRSLVLNDEANHIVIVPVPEQGQGQGGRNQVWVIVSLQKRVWDHSWRKTPPDFSQKSKASDPTKRLE
jgi:hypothetical protein